MSEAVRLVRALDEGALGSWLTSRRWFGSKSREVAGVHVTECVAVRDVEPLAALALIEVRFQPGTHDTYQVLFGFRPEGGWEDEVVAAVDGRVAYDAFRDSTLGHELVHLMRGGQTLRSEEGQLDFCALDALASHPEVAPSRPVGAEQSNTSIVFGDDLILKAYRRIEAGVNPELELLRFLTEHEFPNVPALHGWYQYSGRLMDATLGILQEFIRGRSDGWEFALECLRTDPEEFVRQAHRLGEVTGAMHTVLGSDPDDPAFAPEEPSVEALALLTASVDEEIDQLFLDLPENNEAVAPLRGRGEEVRDQLRLLSTIGPVGRVIRHHGDYHLGQVLWTGEDWIVLDFEGEPARPISERRRKRSPLRDVAGMLRSFAYAAFASQLTAGVEPPRGWEQQVRDQFMDGYVAEVDSRLLPSGQEAIERLLTVFELEKAIYELRYELDNRPDWVRIPVAGIERMLELTQ
jgi:trehalose synthase-fused probable maltokinase